MQFKETNLLGCYTITNFVLKDKRGIFVSNFRKSEFEKLGLDSDFKEFFHSYSNLGVIRGMHFEIPPADRAKYVFVTKGKILDVVIDLRKNSKSYLQYFCTELSEDNNRSIYIPSGLAHGFQSLSDLSIMNYHLTKEFSYEHYRGILWNSFGMQWPIKNPIIDERDSRFPRLEDFDNSF